MRVLIIISSLLLCYSKSLDARQKANNNNLTLSDWKDTTTHSIKAKPDYSVVFAQNKVNTLDIKMTAADWTSIQKNMNSLCGFAFGTNGARQDAGEFPGADPDYVAVSVKFNNIEWHKVGFRLKGNSSLSNSWNKGIYKLPFRLHFDKFEKEYPQIKDQRFYGFRELSLSPGANDNSLIREKAGADIFIAAGIPSAQTSFYKVYIDFGAGRKYCGVYTMVEVIDDTMIENQFGSDKENIYKPESNLANFVASEFEKKNNKKQNDYSDVKSFIAILNSDTRFNNPNQWRSDLEKSFNVDHFLKWLAVNTTMFNWDTYGTLAHNYYLYNDPNKKLTWIPWDNNECMSSSRFNSPVTMSLSSVSDNWPLIRNLMDDPVYSKQYKVYVKQFVNEVFTPDKMNQLFDRYHNLISAYVVGPAEKELPKYTQLTSAASFNSELIKLKQHVVNRNQLASDYLK